MKQIAKTTLVVSTAVWAGSIACIGLIVAPYLFVLGGRESSVVPSSGAAAELIGPLLYGSDVATMALALIAAPLLLLLRRGRIMPLGGRFYLSEILFLIALAASSINYWVMTPKLTALQNSLSETYGGFHLAPKSDPAHIAFTSDHQMATSLFLLVLVVGLIALVMMANFQHMDSEQISEDAGL